MAKKSNKKNWIKGAIKNPGAFTAKAKAAKMSVAQYRDKVLANPEDYPVATVQQARLAKTLSKFEPGGNPYAMPTSAATSGYTSNMSHMAGAQNAALQLQQLQQEAVDFQNRNAAAAKARSEEEDAAQLQGMQQDFQTLATDETKDAIARGREARLERRIARTDARKALNAAKAVGAKGKFATEIAQGTADAGLVAQSSKNTGQLLSNLSAYGQTSNIGQAVGQTGTAAQTAATAGEAASQTASTAGSVGVGPYAAAAALAGKGIEHLSDDDDATKTSVGEGFGRGLSGAGSGVGMAAMLGLGPIGLVGAGLLGGYMALRKQRKAKLAAREEEAKLAEQGERIGDAEQQAFLQSQLETGRDMGYNIGSSGTNSYLPGYQMMGAGGDPIKRMLRKRDKETRRAQRKFNRQSKKAARKNTNVLKTGGGPEMIKRADGSYSQRGLWDNIRANKGSGKKPTAEMLKQEKKIKGKMQGGGYDPTTEAYLDRVDPKRLGMGIKPDYTPETMMLGAGTATRGLLNAAAPKILNRAFRGALPGKTRALTKQLEPKIMTDLGVSFGTIAPSISDQKENKKAGGYMRPLPGGAVEFVGPKHSKGGIKLDKNTEVEGGETMDKVNMKSNGGAAGDYIFSDFLKLGKKTFAQRHKEMLARGASQADIQKLAKMQEEVARREGRDENGPRDPDNIMMHGGARMYQSAGGVNYNAGDGVTGVIPNPDEIDKYELDPESAYARDFPEGQSRTEEGLYRRADGDTVTMAEVEHLKMNNPWYDFEAEGFDPTDAESVKKFQQAYNDRVPESARIKVDGKVGEQTVSAYIPYKLKAEEAPAAEETPAEEAPAEEAPVEETPEAIPAVKLRNTPMLPYQLIGPIAELTSKYPQPNTIAASPTGRIKLPRVNFNSERAALSNQVSSANRYIEGQAAGPAAISSKLSMLDKQRKGNIETANAEARTNKDLMAREELANLQASQFDAGQTFAARQFNAIAKNQRDQNEYEKRMLAYNQLGTNLAQYSNDLRSYKAEERIAEASQIDNEYTRQKYLEQLRRDSKKKKSPYYGMNDAQLREAAARMVESAPTYQMQNERRMNALLAAQQAAQGNQTNQTNTEPTTAKRGGYIKKYGKVKRKK